jgi:hypothetical protein
VFAHRIAPLRRTRSRDRHHRAKAHAIVRNPTEADDEPGKRRLLIGRTDGGRLLTLVIEQTIDPTTWLIVTGWSATSAERNLLSR